MTTIGIEELDALEKVALAATPGPWTEDRGGLVRGEARRKVASVSIAGKDSAAYEADIAHIATFDPPTILRLIAALRAKAGA